MRDAKKLRRSRVLLARSRKRSDVTVHFLNLVALEGETRYRSGSLRIARAQGVVHLIQFADPLLS
jgi:hypothetical protein